MSTRVALVPIHAMPNVPGLCVPDDVYWILDRPVPLLGMVRPTSSTPWPALFALGVRRVACLTDNVPPYDPAPLSFACVIELEDLFHRIAPAHPTDEIDKIRVAVLSILSALSRGEGVVVHCAGGTGRTGTVIGATLAVLGVPVSEAIRHLQLVHEARGRSWPESSWQQDVLEQRGVDWEPTAKA
jgi:hypothetical protein